MNTGKTASSDKAQLDKFKEAAKQARTDDSEEAFDRVVKGVAKTPPAKTDRKE
jgi:hypothetical protein